MALVNLHNYFAGPLPSSQKKTRKNNAARTKDLARKQPTHITRGIISTSSKVGQDLIMKVKLRANGAGLIGAFDIQGKRDGGVPRSPQLIDARLESEISRREL